MEMGSISQMHGTSQLSTPCQFRPEVSKNDDEELYFLK